MEVRNFLLTIFGSEYLTAIKSTPYSENYSGELQHLENWIQTLLKSRADYEKEELQKDDRDGRIGFRMVNLRIKTQFGTVTMNDARTSIIAQSGTATVCGDCVVCRGKWMYEIQLKSRGSMRLGWLKHGQKCTRDKGVGDVFGSYGFDGNQKRLSTSGSLRVYGEIWHTGDIIGLLVDFGKQTVEYLMNGRSLGRVGIDHIQFLYPAVTLSKFESIYVNFGREPFCYPVAGYEPLQRPNLSRMVQAEYFSKWIGATLDLMEKSDPKVQIGDISTGILLYEVLKIIEIFFTELIHDSYTMTSSVIPFMLNLITKQKSPTQFMHFLNFLWDFVNTDSLTYTLRVIFERLRLSFREAAISLDYVEQKNSLLIINELLKHRPTRLFAIKYVFFDRCDFGYFFHVKPLDDYCMSKDIPDVWWATRDSWLDKKKKAYEHHGQKMFNSLNEIERIQNNIIQLLLINNDGSLYEPSTRTIFLSELRDFAVIQKFSTHLGLNLDMPPPVALTTFFKLLIAFDNKTHGLTVDQIVPNHIFYDGSISYEFCDRLGGLEDYLRSTLRNDIQKEEKRIPPIVEPEATPRPLRTDNTKSMILSIIPPEKNMATNIKVSCEKEKEREKFTGSPFVCKHEKKTSLTPMPPLATNLAELTTGMQPRASATSRIGLMVLADPSIRGSIRNTHQRHSISRLLSQLGVQSNEMTSADAINVLSQRADQQAQASTARGSSIPGLTSIVESTANSSNNPSTQRGFAAALSPPAIDTRVNSNQSSIPGPMGLPMGSLGPNDLVLVALRDLLPTRTLPGDVNVLEELIKLPNNRKRGVIDEKASNVELLDVILFIFMVLGKRQLQKIAEIYLRFESHEQSWDNLKTQEKLLIKRSRKHFNSSIQMDPFDAYALTEETTGESWVRRTSVNGAKKLSDIKPDCRYKTDVENSHNLAAEVLGSAIAGHEKILNELARDKLWVRNVVLTPDRAKRMFGLLTQVADILIAESNKDQLFSFLPDFYLLVVECLVTGLFNHMPVIYDIEEEFPNESRLALDHMISLLNILHGDARLAKEDCKDALDRIFATLVDSKYTLSVLEKITPLSQQKLILNLMKSYNVKRNVAANWIFVRFWHGDGYAFRYKTVPNTSPTINKWMHLNINYSLANLTPNPSKVFQRALARELSTNTTEASIFFNNILNNMNWACSEFLNMLQEVKQVAIKKEPVIVEPHTLHLISACFDFAVGMVRVIEMAVKITNGVIVPDNNEVLISRLMQTICLTISRLTEEKGCFRIFLDIEMPSAETIQSFPMVSGLIGVLIAIFQKDIDDFSKGKLKEEPSSLIKLLYKDCADHVDALDNVINSTSDFRLVNNPIYYDHITKEEQKELLALLKMVQHFKHALTNVALPDEEHICIICYSNIKDVYFEPCRHESCLICVKQLLMDSRNCFFCKTPIREVHRLSGELVTELLDRDEYRPRHSLDHNLDMF